MPVNTQAAGGMGPGVLPNISIPNILPHAGNQQDLNYVMNLLNELSSQVRENRENTERIVEGVRRIHVRGQNAAPGPQVADSSDPDGEPNEHRPAESTNDLLARIAELERQNSVLTQERDHARLDAASWEKVNEHYQNTLTFVNDKVRDYTSQCNQAMFAWHHHYNDLLQKEKDANLAMRMEHSRWQEGLGRALEYSRQALRARTEELEPYEIERAELRTQNKCYRRLLGLGVAESEDEDDDEDRPMLEDDEMRLEILEIATQKLKSKRHVGNQDLTLTTKEEEKQYDRGEESRKDSAIANDDLFNVALGTTARTTTLQSVDGATEDTGEESLADDTGHHTDEAHLDSTREQDQVNVAGAIISGGTARALAFGREMPQTWRHSSRSMHRFSTNVLGRLEELMQPGSRGSRGMGENGDN